MSKTTPEKLEAIAKKSFESPDETIRPWEKVKVDVVTISGLKLLRVTVEPGWNWTEHAKPVAGTDRCMRFHVKVFVAGRFAFRMEDGTEMMFGPGDIGVIQPGHDAWVVGDETVVYFDLAEAVKLPA